MLVGHRKKAPPVQVTVATTTCASRVSAPVGHRKRPPPVQDVLGEVLGIGNLYCRPFYSAASGPCARLRDFENQLLSDVLANFGRFLPPLILEQTLTALLADGQRHSFETALNRSSTSRPPQRTSLRRLEHMTGAT